MKTCSVPGCTNHDLKIIRGYCSNHYQNLLKAGKLQKVNGVKQCYVPDCINKYYCSGYCRLHYHRLRYNGTTNAQPIRQSGTGCITPYGYLRRSIAGVIKFEHVRIVEKVLGKSLPSKAHVHHIDGNKLNNENRNLVVCPDNAYHMLIEARTRAYNACGHADWRKCKVLSTV